MYIVDRFEGEFAICEDSNKQMHPIKKTELPSGVKEGDCIRYLEHGYVIDVEATKERRDRIRKLMSSLFEQIVSLMKSKQEGSCYVREI